MGLGRVIVPVSWYKALLYQFHLYKLSSDTKQLSEISDCDGWPQIYMLIEGLISI